MPPKISVVIPMYNAAAYLRPAIESVLAQTRPADEILLVDDGSADESCEIAREYRQEAVRCLRMPHAGIAAARNRGITAAGGDFIAFLDADDLWEPCKLSLQMELFAADDSLGMVFGGLRQFISEDLAPEEQAELQCPAGVSPGYQASALISRRCVFERVGLFDESLRNGEFIDWYSRARAAGIPEGMVGLPVAWRRLHRTNYGRTHRETQADYLQVLRSAILRRRREQA